MNEGSGTTLHTTSSTGNNITIAGETWGSVPGFPGSVPTFSAGAGSGGIGTNYAATNFDGSTPFSACGWFNASGIYEAALLGDLNISGGFQGWEIGIETVTGSGSNIQVALINNYPNAIAVQTTTTLSPSTLYHACFTYDGSGHAAGVTVYLNGLPSATTNILDSLSGTTASNLPVYLAQREDNTSRFGGTVGDWRIYNLQLTAAQVALLYASGPQ